MVTSDELKERFTDANPVTSRDAEGWSQGERGRAARLELREEMRRKPKATSRGFRRPVVVYSLATLTVLSLGAATWMVTQRSVSDPTVVACFGSFSQEGDLFGYSMDPDQSSGSAAEKCAGHWEDDWGTAVPANLVECVTNYPDGQGGGLGVFPAPLGMSQEDACAALGAALPKG